MPSPTTYRFRPLATSKAIRLLRLGPSATRNADLRDKLIEAETTRETPYEALSYVWGKEDFVHSLHLEDGGMLVITENLDAALRRLRYPDRERTLWIDAVCINQSDLVEKGPQVENMANIYKDAAQVVAWLGDPPAEIDTAAILDLADTAEEVGLKSIADSSWDTLRSWMYGIKERRSQIMKVGEHAQLANFSSLYKSSWFTRMWIVQEAVLARNLLLLQDNQELPWLDLEKTALLLRAITTSLRTPVPSPSLFDLAWSLIEVRHQ